MSYKYVHLYISGNSFVGLREEYHIVVQHKKRFLVVSERLIYRHEPEEETWHVFPHRLKHAMMNPVALTFNESQLK